jgi:CubicO group peptidase (beta-lactamase class C family)
VNLDAIVATWPVQAAVAVIGPSGTLATSSGSDVVRRFASVTKPIAVLGILDAVRSGELELDARRDDVWRRCCCAACAPAAPLPLVFVDALHRFL